MKIFWKKAVQKFLLYAVLITSFSVGLTLIQGGYTMGYIIFKLIFLPSMVLIYRGVVTWVEYFLMTRWAKKFEVSMELIAFTVYVMKYDLSAFVPEETRKKSIENAKRIFYK